MQSDASARQALALARRAGDLLRARKDERRRAAAVIASGWNRMVTTPPDIAEDCPHKVLLSEAERLARVASEEAPRGRAAVGIGVAAVLLLPFTGLWSGTEAQGPLGWSVAYFAGLEADAPLVHRAQRRQLDLDFGMAAPGPDLPLDRFRVRAESCVRLDGGTYRLRVVTGDQVDVFVDGRGVLHREETGAEQPVTRGVDLAAGTHLVAVELRDLGGAAGLRLELSRTDGPLEPGSPSPAVFRMPAEPGRCPTP